MDLLLSFSDFAQFKEMMIFERAHFVATTPKPKSSKAAALGLHDGAGSVDMKNPPQIVMAGNKASVNELKYFENCIDSLIPTVNKLIVQNNEQNDGEERNDLNLQIN